MRYSARAPRLASLSTLTLTGEPRARATRLPTSTFDQWRFGANVMARASTSTRAGTATVMPAIVLQLVDTASTVWRTMDARARNVWWRGAVAASMARVRWKITGPPRRSEER